MAITDLIYGLTPHLQQNQMIKSMAMPRMNLSSEDYNVISSMNAANNMNAGITSLFGPAALYTLGDTISNPNQNFMEGLSDFGRYMKGVQIADNPGLARKLMGNAYVNDMQSKYDRAMNEIGLFTPSRTPMMDIANQDLDPVLEQFYSSPTINKTALTKDFRDIGFQDFYDYDTYDVYDPEKDDEQVDYLPGQYSFKDRVGKFAKNVMGQPGISSLIGLINPVAGLVSRGLGYLGRNLSPSFVGPKGARGYGSESVGGLFARSNTFADFFQNVRDKRARDEAAARGAAKQADQARMDAFRAFKDSKPSGGGNGGGGIGSSYGGSASPGSQGPGGSDAMGSF